jgi:transposase
MPSPDRVFSADEHFQALEAMDSAAEKYLRSQGNEEKMKVAAADLFKARSIVSNARTVKGSENSHLSPSGDLSRKRKARDPGERKPGGQQGHPGKTIDLTSFTGERREVVVDPPPEVKANPGRYRLTGNEGDSKEVADISFTAFVTEDLAEEYEDLTNGELVRTGQFPPVAKDWVQYGPTVTALALLLRTYLLVPYDRLATFLQQLSGFSICAATVVAMVERCYGIPALAASDLAIRAKIRLSGVLHADETGFNLQGIKAWCHVLATDVLTFLAPYRKRGRKALDAIRLLKTYPGTVVHDCLSMYFAYGEYESSLCLAHIIRELVDPADMEFKQAESLIGFFLELSDAVDARSGALLGYEQKKWRRRFKGLRTRARNELFRRVPMGADGKPDEGPYRKHYNLLERLTLYEDAVLRFMTDPEVAFTNNEAERALRMLKVVMKVSGCFRSPEHANGFFRMRSYLDTCRKMGLNQFAALMMLIGGSLPPFFAEWEAEAKAKGVWTTETYNGMLPTAKEDEAVEKAAEAAEAAEKAAKAVEEAEEATKAAEAKARAAMAAEAKARAAKAKARAAKAAEAKAREDEAAEAKAGTAKAAEAKARAAKAAEEAAKAKARATEAAKEAGKAKARATEAAKEAGKAKSRAAKAGTRASKAAEKAAKAIETAEAIKAVRAAKAESRARAKARAKARARARGRARGRARASDDKAAAMMALAS